jgi:hypothetical protein
MMKVFQNGFMAMIGKLELCIWNKYIIGYAKYALIKLILKQ